jgi:hypothetical protein
VATATEIRSLAQSYRAQQVQRAAIMAALVAAYYRSRVDVEDPTSIERWLEIMVPRILAEHNRVSTFAAAYDTANRRLELPSAPEIRFTPSTGAVEEQVRKSLLVVGPGDYLNKARQIEQVDVSDQQREALLAEAKQVTTKKVAAAVARHTQNGGRKTLIDASESDATALGYVRVTKDSPCFFCAMLASRGLVFAADSFEDSDPRFTGDGTAKVHDSCQCSMKPVYDRKTDPILKDSEVYTDLWAEWGAGGGDAALRFRRGYEHFVATGEKLSWEVANSAEAFRARKSAA